MATSDASGDDAEDGTVERPTGAAGAREPPAVGGLPLLGNTLDLVRDPLGFHDRVRAMDADVVSYRVLRSRGYVLTHPDHVERVLVGEQDRFARSEVTQESLGQVVDGEGLLLSDGDAWARQRKLLQPAFYRERIEGYADAMSGAAEDVVAGWDDGDVVPVRDEMQQLTLQVLADTLFGVDLDDRGAAVDEAAAAILARFDAEALSAYLPPWVPTRRNRRFTRAIDAMEAVVDELVAERRGDVEGRDDLLSLLLAAGDGEGLDDSEVRANMVTFLIAGHETTSLALTYALTLLATHPGEAERLRAELATVDGRPGPGDLAELDHLDRVLTETLRLYPPAYTVFREATEPVVFDGYEVPPGANISLPQWVVHRDERWYDDPHEFRPDRWTDGLEEELPDYAYYPFGGGPRACIGMRFARLEAKLALAAVVPEVSLTPVADEPLDPQMAITLQPGGPVEMRVERR